MMPLAFLTTDREWPWRDGDLLGAPGLVLVAGLLVGLTLWTYLGHREVGWRRLLLILGLRLGALAVTTLLILRPSFASEEQIVTSGKLIVVLDCSSSMLILDGPNSSSRWDTVRKLFDWPEVKEALERLQKDRQIEILFYQGAEDVRRYEPSSSADGKRTDIGQWLHTLNGLHKSDKNLRGLLIFSDGQDNGTRFLAVDEAAQWRGLSCPVHTFGVGSETTSKGQKDIAVVDLKTDKDRSDFVYKGNEINVKAVVDAPGLEGQLVTVRLLADGKEVGMKGGVPLPATRGNIIDAGKVIAEQIGEMKITVKIDEVPGEFTALNNELTTYVNVRKKGINVLWVDARYREESTWIMRRALKKDTRFNIVHLVRPQDVPLTPQERALFSFDGDKAFDVVVIGDISAALFSGHDPSVLQELAKKVASKRTGLLMLGAAKTIHEDWRATPLASLLPVQLDDPREITFKIEAIPDPANKGHRLLQIDALTGKDVWQDVFKKLEGMSQLGKVRPGASVLLRADSATGEPLFVIGKEDASRVAVFGAGNTYQAWYSSDEAIRVYERFWTQLMAWLAGQEKGDNQVWIKLDRRRLPAGAKQRLGFTVGMIGEDGAEVKNPNFEVSVTAPSGDKQAKVPVRLKAGEFRGEFDQVSAVGEYLIEVKVGSAAPASAHFVAFSEDVENQRPAANYQFLTRVAEAGGGAFHMAGKEELLQYLGELRDRSSAQGWVRRDVWPNWKYVPASDAFPDQLSAMVASGALPAMVLFLILVCTEWFLRRWWGLV